MRLRYGLSPLVACAVLWTLASAQQTTGKIQGSVTDQSGTPLAAAQVFIVGTSFGAVTNEQGYYFINNVPVGSYTVRGQFIGFAPSEVRDVRVLGGQTITVDVKLQPSAVVVGGVSVTVNSNPIVPRDQVASKSIVSGDLVNSLPVDNVQDVITLQPGVVATSGGGISLRGGRRSEANIYIDGAPVRSSNFGGDCAGQSQTCSVVTVGTNAVEEASVTTGALGAEFGDAQSGVISFTTKSGGQSLSGNLSYQTDEPFGNSISYGLNRAEGSLGGPVPGIHNLRFFVSGVAQGQATQFPGVDPLEPGVGRRGFDQIPTFVMGPSQTTIADNDGNMVAVPTFIQYGGSCDASKNYGQSCKGLRAPYDWSDAFQLQGKLSYSYGSGSSVSLTALANGQQGRNSPAVNVGDPALYSGYHDWQRLYVLNLNHSFFKSAERELALNVNLSLGRDRGIAGALDPASEAESRNPTLGLQLKPLGFAGLGVMPFPITDEIIRNIRTNSGLRTPFNGRTDLRNAQPYRTNPYGLSSNWPTTGLGAAGTLNAEDRYRAFAQVDWQVNRFHRFNFGAEAKQTHLAYWTSSLLNQIFMDAYVVRPVTYSAWLADRLDLGDVVVELGGRYDYMDSKALFANTPSRIFTNPGWQSGAATDDAAYQASLASVFTPAQAHHTISPRLRVSFPITERTDFRLSYSHQVQTPDFNTLLSGVNNDLSFTNTNDAFGRDVGFGKTILFEFGVRHAFSPDLVLDVAAYNKDFVSELAYRITPYDDPSNPGRTLNLNVLTTGDFGYARGVDVKLDKRIGSWLDFSGAYTFQVAKSTGSDPFSYLRTSARQIQQVSGDRFPPPEQPLPTDDNRTHNIVGAVTLNVPADWQKGTALGTVFRDVGVFATFRALSGLPYTRVKNSGAGAIVPRQGFGLTATSIEPINSSTMPWTKYVDMRVNKGFRLGRADITAFADVRNLFNFRNVLGLYAETGDVVNALFEEQQTSPQFSSLRIEAQQNGRLLSGGSIDLRPACSSWTGTAGGPVNCVALRQVEAAFGDGDQVYTLAEQTAALNAAYVRFNGPQTFYGQPRQVRLGFELNF
jgi:Carboxypeptidase regulatory-like domain/TonB-dependent Receptor Plug Domain